MKRFLTIAAAAVLTCCLGDAMPVMAEFELPYATDCPTFISNYRTTMERINSAGGGSNDLTPHQQQSLAEAVTACDESDFN